jgi:predicted extracellular nuclease
VVLGTATEFFNLTQLESSLPGDVSVTSSGNPLPASMTFTTTILNPAGPVDQLERFEGMRMHADTLVSVAPTNEFGETFTVWRVRCANRVSRFPSRSRRIRPQTALIAAFRVGTKTRSES